jgi:hypothetical protein
MPITPFLNGEQFDAETRRVLGVALEMSCIALRTGDCDDGVRQAIASKIIELAKAGERRAGPPHRPFPRAISHGRRHCRRNFQGLMDADRL